MKTLGHPPETLAALEELFAVPRHTHLPEGSETLPTFYPTISISGPCARHVHKYSIVSALSGVTTATM